MLLLFNIYRVFSVTEIPSRKFRDAKIDIILKIAAEKQKNHPQKGGFHSFGLLVEM